MTFSTDTGPLVSRGTDRSSHRLGAAGITFGVALALLILFVGLSLGRSPTYAVLPGESTTPANLHLRLGQEVLMSQSANFGVRRLATTSLVYPAESAIPEWSPGAGLYLAVAGIKVCAGSYDAAPGWGDAHWPLFTLDLSDGSFAGLGLPPAREPTLESIQTIRAGTCAVGFLTFNVPIGKAPVAVEFNEGHRYRWLTR